MQNGIKSSANRQCSIHTNQTLLHAATRRPSSACNASSTKTKAPSKSLKGAEVSERTTLGDSGLEVDTLCIGAWSWNDRSNYWGQEGYGNHGNYNEADLREAYRTLLDLDLTFIDTAEVYGVGKSEELIGDLKKSNSTVPAIATKFAPLPWRFSADNVVNALKGSLSRLQRDQVDLYQIHWPGFPFLNNWATNKFVEGLGRAHKAGLTKAVGVSNFKAVRVREANKILQDADVPLASNQVQYSLLYRAPERNGVIEACRETNTALLAYSPLTQGLLSGKYTTENKPGGPRAALFNDDKIRSIQPLLGLMKEIGSGHGGKTQAQVAINWIISKGQQEGITAIPILGVKNKEQAEAAKGVLGWRLTKEELDALDRVSSVSSTLNVMEAQMAPFEKW